MEKLVRSDEPLADERILDSEFEDLSGTTPSSPADDVRQLKQMVAQLELELRTHRQATTALEQQLERAKETLSFRLGYLLIHAPKSWSNLFKLPRELLALQREAALRRKARHSPHQARSLGAEGDPNRWRRPEQFAEDVFRKYLEQGLPPAVAFLEAQAKNDSERASALNRLTRSLKTTDPPRALELAQRAYELEPTPSRAKSLAFLQHACGEIRRPGQLLRSLPESAALRPTEHDRMVQILGLARLQERLPRASRAAVARAYEPILDSCVYVTASSLPFNVSGYTTRSHALLHAITGAGFRVNAALRPGYPADRGVLLPGATHEHDGVVYHQSPGPNSRLMPLDEYVQAATQALAQLARRTRPQLIHAASNHVNALPALLAARQLGVPFVYEVRGMWELTAATRNVDWEKTERFQLEQQLETFVAREADQVFTLTQGLVDDLASRGVARERMTIIPNCVDPSRFAPRPKDPGLLKRLGIEAETFILVYAGSLLHYEGLDDVLQAIALLSKKGVRAAFVIAGDGEASESLRRESLELGIERQVHFIGKVEPSNIPQLWSLADAAAFARKPFRVCELVSPLKPLEPMMMGVPVVVSDVTALKEMVRDRETGLVHRAGDATDLAAKLMTLALDPELRQSLGRAARAATLRDRTWAVAGERVVERYRSMTGRPNEPNRVISRESASL